jgi:hypothetical protein
LLHCLPTAVAALVSVLGRGCSLARSVLGSDYDAADYAVFAGRGAYGFLATVLWGRFWERWLGDCGELFRAAPARICV